MWIWRASGGQHKNPNELWAPEEEMKTVRGGHIPDMFQDQAKWIFFF